MPSTIEAIYIILIAGELTVGILGNGFIVLVNCIDWLKRRDVSLIDIILISLAISRICLLCVISLDGFFVLVFQDAYENYNLLIIMDVVWTTANNSSLWFTSCLSIFYLLKIVNISHPFFFWLKLKINKVILGVLLGSFLISLIMSISVNIWYHFFNANHEENITQEFKVSKIPNAFKQITLNLGAMVPFIICLISFFLLLFSLVRHTKQIQLHATGFRDPSTEAHMRAMKAMIIFLLLLIVYYSVFLVITSSTLIPQGKLVLMIGGIVTVIFPASHSLILIMGNSKLREAFLKMLRFVKGFLRRRKPFAP
ncbi:taste receptor type 2 member 9 [Saimiri boliviensis]|uniref:taste receptor type 2 member 9 n=1 Tax=Saimiri boliviensis TaxID=27679 RepID=UPI00193CF631|nr:taste receptor type 2 member 9 [Saimiri boliviensis boliviensis]